MVEEVMTGEALTVRTAAGPRVVLRTFETVEEVMLPPLPERKKRPPQP
jgi:hypothetical protein